MQGRTKEYLGTIGITALCSAFLIGGMALGKNAYSPKQVYSKSEGNGNYIVVSTENNSRYIFVEQPNGSYKTLDELQGEQKSQLEEMAKQLK